MGLFKKLLGREDEEADAFGKIQEAAAANPLVSFQSHPTEATWSTVMVNGKPLAPDQANAFTSAFEQLGNLASMGSTQVVDLRNVPGLRDQVLGAMQDHANDPAALQSAVLSALQAAAPQVPELQTTGAASPAAPVADPLDRLKKLDGLRHQGAITDDEFQAQKKKLLEEL